MAFLTFAEAKVVAPPILPRKFPAHTVQITTHCDESSHHKLFPHLQSEQRERGDHQPCTKLKSPPSGRGLINIASTTKSSLHYSWDDTRYHLNYHAPNSVCVLLSDGTNIRHIQDTEENCDVDRTIFSCFSPSGHPVIPCPSDIRHRPHNVKRVTKLIKVDLLDDF